MYLTYDVTDKLETGENVISVVLGNGWYNCFAEDPWNTRAASWRHWPKMIDEDSSIITILVGQDVNEEEMNQVAEMIGEKFSDLDLDIRPGNQPVYSFLIGVE